MAYYNNYPMYPQQYQPPVMQNQGNQQTGLNWVQGEAAAKAYLVAPGCTVQLWDSEEKVIYLKSADASGMPSMKVLDYTIRGDAPEKPAVATPDAEATAGRAVKDGTDTAETMAVTPEERAATAGKAGTDTAAAWNGTNTCG